MSEEIAEYEIGKRHVANIMGLDPETITQEDISVSLNPIFCCHLHSDLEGLNFILHLQFIFLQPDYTFDLSYLVETC